MKITKNVISAIFALAVTFTMLDISFADADPKENVVINTLCDSADWTAETVRMSSVVSGTRTVVDFNTVDENDTVHGDVLKYSYAPSQTMGGVVMYEQAFNYKSPGKKLSFDFYVYDNTIPYEIRLMCCESLISNTKYISQFNINYSDYAIITPNENAKIGILDGGQASSNEKASMSVTNREWHKMEIIINEKKADYYIDGTYLGVSNIPDDTVAASFNSFSGVQVVSRADRQAASVTELSGLYLDNIKIQGYDENSLFYGVAEANDDEIVVELSESVLSDSPINFADVKVYNTKTSEEVDIEAPELKGFDTVVIPLSAKLEKNTEYLIIMPDDLIGISKKPIHKNCYFTVQSSEIHTYMNEDFSEYGTIEDNNTDICVPETDYYTAGMINVKDSGEDGYGKVLCFGTGAAGGGFKAGIKNNDSIIDVSKGKVNIEFDIKLVNNDYTRLYMQPYSTIKGVDDVSLTDTEISGNSVTNYPSQFCNITVSSAIVDGGNPWIQMRRTSNAVVNSIAKGSNGNYGDEYISKGDWHKVKISIDNSLGTVPDVELYVDDNLVTNNLAGKDLRGSAATDYLRGIRFVVEAQATGNVHDYFYIDNVRFMGPASNATVSKIRMYNIDGEAFGPIATENLKPSADTAEIYFAEAVDITDATVYLAGGSKDIVGTLSEFDSVNKKVTVIFNEPMDKGTTYELTVTGVKSTDGTLMSDYAARFTTNDVEEFLITDLKIADENGNKITRANEVKVGDTVYPNVKIINTFDDDKTALLLITEYNSLAMTNANYAAYNIPAGTSRVITNQIPLIVRSLNDLAINGYIWEGFDSNKPLTDMVVCD